MIVCSYFLKSCQPESKLRCTTGSIYYCDSVYTQKVVHYYWWKTNSIFDMSHQYTLGHNGMPFYLRYTGACRTYRCGFALPTPLRAEKNQQSAVAFRTMAMITVQIASFVLAASTSCGAVYPQCYTYSVLPHYRVLHTTFVLKQLGRKRIKDAINVDTLIL